jgi:CxxC-x17-CxxC domain-containing protein
MHQGNWTCSGCGGAITELPFEPRRTDGLTCRACFMKNRDNGQAGDSVAGDAGAPKARVEGNWSCSGCGAAITSLPFTPRDTSNLKCMDCFKKSKA